MDREEIEKEVMRLQARCYTEEGKAGIVTDYIMRLLREQESQLTQACSLTAGMHSAVKTHRYWNCPDIKNGPSNISTSWENVDCHHCLVTGGQVSPFVTSGS